MKQQDKDFAKNWLKVDPIETPILNKELPKHDPERFAEYTELKDEEDNVVGFCVNEQNFFFDADGGWRDEKGCYYDKDGSPAGWFVLHNGPQYHEHFYGMDGMYVPSDVENDKDDVDDVSSDENVQDVKDLKQFDVQI